jgi:hypothetical protein
MYCPTLVGQLADIQRKKLTTWQTIVNLFEISLGYKAKQLQANEQVITQI